MIASRRDFILVLIMLAILLGGFTYLLGAPVISEWRRSSDMRSRMDRDRAIAERILETRGEWEEKLSGMRASLPLYSMEQRVGAELLMQVRKLADENKIVTTRITPDEERMIGDLYEQAIEVSWEAALEPLVRFLYAVQVAGATLDIRQMTITPAQGDTLKGNLKIYFAYQRADAGAPAGEQINLQAETP